MRAAATAADRRVRGSSKPTPISASRAPSAVPSSAIHSAGSDALAPRGFNAHGSAAGPKPVELADAAPEVGADQDERQAGRARSASASAPKKRAP